MSPFCVFLLQICTFFVRNLENTEKKCTFVRCKVVPYLNICMYTMKTQQVFPFTKMSLA